MTASAEADRRAASSPDTPIERLDDLASPWPEEVATNRVWSRRAAAEPSWLDAVELRTLWAMCVSPIAVKMFDLDRLVDRLNGHEDSVARAVHFAYLSNATRPKATRWKEIQGLTDPDLMLFRDRLAVSPDPDPVVGLVVRADCAWRRVGPRLDAAELAALGKRKSLRELFARQPKRDDGERHDWVATHRSEPEMLRIIEALADDQLAEHLFEGTLLHWVPPAVAVAMARRRNPDADSVMKSRIDLCPEAWRVMLYG